MFYDIVMENKIKLAYLAGLLDGEGHFSILYDKKGKTKFNGVVGIVKTDPSMIHWLKDNFGGSIYHWKGKSKKPHWKEKYEWRVYSYHMTDLVKRVLPYLVVKKQHAKILLDFRKTYVKGRAFRGNEIFEKRYNFRSQLKALHHRNQPL